MKTLYINGKFSAQSITGVQRAARELVLALDRLLVTEGESSGTRCVLLCPPDGQPPQLERVEVRVVGRTTRSLQWWEQVQLPWAARDGALLNLSGSAPWVAAGKSVCLLHDAAVFDHPDTYTLIFKLWYRMLFRHLARNALVLLTISAFARERLCAALAVRPGRFRVVQHGADHFDRVIADNSVLGAYGLVRDRFLLVVGTAKQTKNVAAVLAAWRQLKPEAGCTLVWVGGTNRLVFSEPESDLGDIEADVAQGIFRLGFVNDAKLKALYQHAAGLMLPSVYEGFGLPAVEAMACGCPVAAASAASLPEVCGNAAYFFDPAKLDDISKVMETLLNDPDVRTRLRGRGYQRAAELTWNLAANGLVTQLQEARVLVRTARANHVSQQVPSRAESRLAETETMKAPR